MPAHRTTFAVLATATAVLATSIAAQELDPQKFTRTIQRLNSFPTPGSPGSVPVWCDACRQATGEDARREDMAVLLVALDSLFRDNAFDMDAANQYIARIKNCPKSSIDAFHAVLITVDPKQTKTGSIILLIQQDDVFDDSVVDPKTLDSLLARIRQIPKQVVDQWRQISGQKPAPALLQVSSIDLLYTDGAFSESVFAELCRRLRGGALPSLKPLPFPKAAKIVPGASAPGQIFPAYTTELRGSNPVRIVNPNSESVSVGLRLGDVGLDFSVAANGQKTVMVPDGSFDIYFVYASKPTELLQGDSFTLASRGAQITLVKVKDGNYAIRRVK